MKTRLDNHETSARNVEEILESLLATCSQNRGRKVSVGDIANRLGSRSFAPLILAIGLLGVTPIDSIPTLPTIFGVVVFLTAGQMLLGRHSLWLPRFISARSVDGDRLGAALVRAKPAAKRVDAWIGPRYGVFTHGGFLIGIAVCCTALAAIMPFLEFLPFVSTLPSVAFTSFGIALLLNDGLASLLGFVFTSVTMFLVFEVASLLW